MIFEMFSINDYRSLARYEVKKGAKSHRVLPTFKIAAKLGDSEAITLSMISLLLEKCLCSSRLPGPLGSIWPMGKRQKVLRRNVVLGSLTHVVDNAIRGPEIPITCTPEVIKNAITKCPASNSNKVCYSHSSCRGERTCRTVPLIQLEVNSPKASGSRNARPSPLLQYPS